MVGKQEDGQMGKYIAKCLDDSSCSSETQKGIVAGEHVLGSSMFGRARSGKLAFCGAVHGPTLTLRWHQSYNDSVHPVTWRATLLLWAANVWTNPL